MSIIGSNNANVESIVNDFFTKHVATHVQPLMAKEGGLLIVNVNGSVTIVNDKKKDWFPTGVKFGHIFGDFTCFNSHISSMLDFPVKVSGNFICLSCPNIQSLDGIPKTVGGNCKIQNCGRKFTEAEIRRVCDVSGDVN